MNTTNGYTTSLINDVKPGIASTIMSSVRLMILVLWFAEAEEVGA